MLTQSPFTPLQINLPYCSGSKANMTFPRMPLNNRLQNVIETQGTGVEEEEDREKGVYFTGGIMVAA